MSLPPQETLDTSRAEAVSGGLVGFADLRTIPGPGTKNVLQKCGQAR